MRHVLGTVLVNTEIRLPYVESCTVEHADHDEVCVTVNIDSSQERPFGHGLRLLAERYDPQQYDEIVAQARRELAWAADMKEAMRSVCRFRSSGGIVLDEAIRAMEQRMQYGPIS